VITVTPIPRADIPDAWVDLQDWIRQGYQATGATFDPDFVYQEIAAGRRWLWLVRDDNEVLAAALTQISGSTICILSLGGKNMERWLKPALDEFVTLSRKNAMTAIEIDGRHGWKRTLPDFKHVRTVLRRQL
jgi:hypothetical protein